MTSLTWDAIPSLEAEWAWVPLLDWGGVDTAWHGPLHWTLLKVYNLLLSGWDQSPPWHQGPKEFEGMIQLASTSPGAEVSSKSLLPERAASEAPGAVDLEGISLDGGFVWCHRGKKYWNSSPFVFVQAQSTLFHTHESQLSWLPQEPRVGMQNAAAFWTFSITTAWSPVLTGTSVLKAWGSVMIAVLRKCHGGDIGQIHSKQSQLSGSQIPDKTKPPAQDKMLSVHNCCRNANQNDNGKSDSTSHNGHPCKSTNNKCRKEPGSERIPLNCW